jgi:hypothetical protein
VRSQMFGAALLGRSGGVGTVSISNTSISDAETYPSGATAALALESDGDFNASDAALTQWLLGSTNGSAYECRATLTSGSLSSGTTGSWLALSSTRTWSVTRVSLGSKSCVFLLEIGLLGTNTALASATISLDATVDAS